MSRAEKQAETRERLVAQARSMFLDIGYAATSLDKVAIEAGYSKGAVYSNFDGKEELCLEVLDVIHREKVRGVAKIFSGDSDLDTQLDVFVAWAQDDLVDPRWTTLELEFAAVAGSNPWVANQLVARHREIAELVRLLVVDISQKFNLRGQENADKTATALLSVGVGLGALRSLDPKIDMNVFGEVVRTMIKASSPKPEPAEQH
ncbi:MAG: TetR/AcrR family transcriptional regulator [Actinomycetales bacterium]|nr:TetR/AcrR family transcriptional regulator [Actinomycetales bacterium]